MCSHVETIERWFGVSSRSGRRRANGVRHARLPKAGEILLITGPSGAGKSCLLRRIRRRYPRDWWIDLNRLSVPDAPTVDCFGEQELAQTLAELARVGLADAGAWLTRPKRLSAGQRWRLRLALALHRAAALRFDAAGTPAALVADEFGALLDRVTAAVIARAVRRAVSAAPNLCAILATSHDDLRRALRPDVVVECDF